RSDQRFDLLARDGAGTEDRRLARARAEVKNGRLDADRARPAVEDEIDLAVQIIADVIGGGRADAAGAVGAGPGDGRVENAKQLQRQLVIGGAQGDGGEAGGRRVNDRAA